MNSLNINPPTDPDGEYCLWWRTIDRNAGPIDDDRYATLEHALAARDIASRELHRKHGGRLACGYGIGMLADGYWRELDEH